VGILAGIGKVREKRGDLCGALAAVGLGGRRRGVSKWTWKRRKGKTHDPAQGFLRVRLRELQR